MCRPHTDSVRPKGAQTRPLVRGGVGRVVGVKPTSGLERVRNKTNTQISLTSLTLHRGRFTVKIPDPLVFTFRRRLPLKIE